MGNRNADSFEDCMFQCYLISGCVGVIFNDALTGVKENCNPKRSCDIIEDDFNKDGVSLALLGMSITWFCYFTHTIVYIQTHIIYKYS